MKIKIKDMECRKNNSLRFKKYICKKFEYKELHGKISLGVLKNEKPLCVVREGKEVILNKENYLWMQIGVKELPYWLTALYDDKKNLIEFYFDIIKESNLELENPIFYDMFLDVVYTKNNVILTLDEDELDDALSEKIITKSEYEKVIRDGEKLKKYLKTEGDELITVCKEKLEELHKEIYND